MKLVILLSVLLMGFASVSLATEEVHIDCRVMKNDFNTTPTSHSVLRRYDSEDW